MLKFSSCAGPQILCLGTELLLLRESSIFLFWTKALNRLAEAMVRTLPAYVKSIINIKFPRHEDIWLNPWRHWYGMLFQTKETSKMLQCLWRWILKNEELFLFYTKRNVSTAVILCAALFIALNKHIKDQKEVKKIKCSRWYGETGPWMSNSSRKMRLTGKT